MIVAMNFAFSRAGMSNPLHSPPPRVVPSPSPTISSITSPSSLPSDDLKKRVKDAQSRIKEKEVNPTPSVVLSVEEQDQLSIIMGQKEKENVGPTPIKPTPQDLKKLEEALGLNKKEGEVGKTLDSSLTPSPSREVEESKAESVKATTSGSLEQVKPTNKKVLKYIKRGSDNTEE
jgi:hypothetical protein